MGAIFLSCAIWFAGPFLSLDGFDPFASPKARLAAIGILVSVTGFWEIGRTVVSRRRERALLRAISKSGGAIDMAWSDNLGAASLGSRPLFILIDLPGVGTRSLLRRSGLRLIAGDSNEGTETAGSGSLNARRWWLAEEALLLDIPARAPASNEGLKAWRDLLAELRASRPRRPIDGVILTVPVAILLGDESPRRSDAEILRTRLAELEPALGAGFPVHVVLTTVDVVPGFAEHATRQGEDQKIAVGASIGRHFRDVGMNRIRASLARLSRRLHDHMLVSLQFEPRRPRASSAGNQNAASGGIDWPRRIAIIEFPIQVQIVLSAAGDFLRRTLAGSDPPHRTALHGVYLTVADKADGARIDAIGGLLAHRFGLESGPPEAVPDAVLNLSASDLFRERIFANADLGGSPDLSVRHRRLITVGSLAAAVLAAGLLVPGWYDSFRKGVGLVETVDERILAFERVETRFRAHGYARMPLEEMVSALNLFRDLPGNTSGASAPEVRVAGLDQTDSLGTEIAQAYRRALNEMFLPRLLDRLETHMRMNLGAPQRLHSAFRAYLMLGLHGPIDREYVTAWLDRDWRLSNAGGEARILREDLADHLEKLLSGPMRIRELDPALIEEVRGVLAGPPLSERIFWLIRDRPAQHDVPDWNARTIGGPFSAKVFRRVSGAPLTDGVAAIFTSEGFKYLFLPNLEEIDHIIVVEAWLIGEQAQPISEQDRARLLREILNLYEVKHRLAWDAVLNDIGIIPAHSRAGVADVVVALSGASSPIRRILQSLDYEAELLEEPEPTAAEPMFITIGDSPKWRARRISRKMLIGDRSDGAADPFHAFEERLKARWRRLGLLEGSLSFTHTEMFEVLQSIHDTLRLRISAGRARSKSVSGTASARLREMANELARASPLRTWLIQASAWTDVAEPNRPQPSGVWTSQVLPICERTLSGRYPFDRSAQADVALEDFQRLFAPGGLIDAFFKEHLIDYVDTTTRPWQWKSGLGAALGISASVLTQFQHAADIRDSFFLSGGPPQVTFDLKPIALDSKATSVTLEIEGQTLEYAHQVPQVTPMKWPGDAGGRTRVAFTPQLPNAENVVSWEGPWAWFRVLDGAELRRTDLSDRSKVIFNVGGRIAVFEMRAGSAPNPFSTSVLRKFRCFNLN